MAMIIIGHRGARGLTPENTVAGLRKALEHGVDMIEFDLRVTRDGIVILHHDREITDPSGQKHLISARTYAELKQHKPDLARFEEALTAVDRHVPLYVEVKPDEPIEQIVTIIKAHLAKGWQPEDLRLASKGRSTLVALHQALPNIPAIVIEPWSGVRAHRRARQLGTTLIAMNQRWLWWGFIRGFKHSDWQLYTYTLNNPKKAARWARWGLDGVVTDYPDRFEKR